MLFNDGKTLNKLDNLSKACRGWMWLTEVGFLAFICYNYQMGGEMSRVTSYMTVYKQQNIYNSTDLSFSPMTKNVGSTSNHQKGHL
jgi:hypothetical protein